MISQFCPTLSKDLLKREFLNTAAAFAVLAVLGFAAGMLFPDAAQQLLDRFAAQLEQLGLSSNVPQSQMMATLFFNNVTASLLAMLYGLIPFVPLSALALGTNALLLGAFAALYQHHGIGLGVYFIGILPHGIFELPALTFPARSDFSSAARERKNSAKGAMCLSCAAYWTATASFYPSSRRCCSSPRSLKRTSRPHF